MQDSIFFEHTMAFIRRLYEAEGDVIPLHRPLFSKKEEHLVLDCIQSTFVSSIGQYVDQFEQAVARFTGSRYAVATVNGTAALQVALSLAGVSRGQEVITQAISFVATANAIQYVGAEPIFLDCDRDTLGLSADALELFLTENTRQDESGLTYNRKTGRQIAACVPMHTFGHPVRIERIQTLCERYRIALVEDAAEALGSYAGDRHLGRFGRLGILSFNGNKIITTGGGGMILTDDPELARCAKHLTTTAKVSHKWNYFHDRIGYNFRLPNLNAALGCAQLENIDYFITQKRKIAARYESFFRDGRIPFFIERPDTRSNYWLNAIFLENREDRDRFLELSSLRGIMCRPLWSLLIDLPMYRHCQCDELINARWLSDRLVNIPSSVPK